jgi:hypothetical protein
MSDAERARIRLLESTQVYLVRALTTYTGLSPVVVLAEAEQAVRERSLSSEAGEGTWGEEYQVVGDWGVDYAEDEDAARMAVQKWLYRHPHCGAYAEVRAVCTWPDDSSYCGPWRRLEVKGE